MLAETLALTERNSGHVKGQRWASLGGGGGVLVFFFFGGGASRLILSLASSPNYVTGSVYLF